MERQDKQAKTFDSTVCFTFFGDWVEAIEDAETEADRNSEAYMLFRAIADYSMYGEEPDFDMYPASKSFKRFWPMLTKQIDDSIENRKRGFGAAGMTDNQRKVVEAYRENPNASIRKIVEITGVSRSAVDRARRKYANVIQEMGDSCAGVNPCESPYVDTNVNPDVDTRANPYASTGTGQIGTNRDRAGQRDSTTHSVSGDDVQQEDQFADLTDDDGELPF